MLKAMLTAAVALGYTIVVSYDDETDYEGPNVTEAIEAIEAVDSCDVYIIDEADEDEDYTGWAFIINDLDEDERISDCSGWVDSFISER